MKLGKKRIERWKSWKAMTNECGRSDYVAPSGLIPPPTMNGHFDDDSRQRDVMRFD